jgi:hypothetical protein
VERERSGQWSAPCLRLAIAALDRPQRIPYSLTLQLQKLMGQQTNKIQKKRRRLAYLERKKAKAKVATIKPVKKKAPARKKAEAAPAAVAAPTAE